MTDAGCPIIRSGPGKPNQRSVHELFAGAFPRTKVRHVNRARFPKEKHRNSQKWAKFMNFSFWPFFWFGLPGRLLKLFSCQNFRNPNPYWSQKKYRNTPPICTAVRPPFVPAVPSWLLSLRQGNPTVRLPFVLQYASHSVRQYASHLYGSTFEKVLGGWGHRKVPQGVSEYGWKGDWENRWALIRSHR